MYFEHRSKGIYFWIQCWREKECTKSRRTPSFVAWATGRTELPLYGVGKVAEGAGWAYFVAHYFFDAIRHLGGNVRYIQLNIQVQERGAEYRYIVESHQWINSIQSQKLDEIIHSRSDYKQRIYKRCSAHRVIVGDMCVCGEV